MGRKNYNSYLKKQKAEKKRKAKQEKKQKKEARKNQPSSGNLEDMMAYLDKDGNIIPVEPGGEGSEHSDVMEEPKSEVPNRNDQESDRDSK
jgi:ribosomal protein S4